MIDDRKMRDSMMQLLGKLEAIRFPVLASSHDFPTGYYDLLESIYEQYVCILKELLPNFSH